jgi:DNA-binding NarL/FixJ family response regulator
VTSDEPIRVVIVDDHPLILEGLRGMLALASNVEVIGEAATGADAVRIAEERQPDVVIMDLNMPGMSGIEATRRVVQASPHIGVLVLTMLEDDDSIFAAMRAGARGYLLKDGTRGAVARAVAAVANGEAIYSPGIAARILHYFDPQQHGARLAFPTLTSREREVLELVARGADNATIARRLFVSPKDVRNHVSNVFSKLHVAHRAEAVIKARGRSGNRELTGRMIGSRRPPRSASSRCVAELLGVVRGHRVATVDRPQAPAPSRARTGAWTPVSDLCATSDHGAARRPPTTIRTTEPTRTLERFQDACWPRT